MKNTRTRQSARYRAALRLHLRAMGLGDGDHAQALGRVAQEALPHRVRHAQAAPVERSRLRIAGPMRTEVSGTAFRVAPDLPGRSPSGPAEIPFEMKSREL